MRKMLFMLPAAVLGIGCVERTLTVHSNPTGALVYMNDQEIGRTPLNHDFIFYGVYDVQVRKEGYETLKTGTPVFPPIWQWVPIDLLAQILPLRLHDEHLVSYTLKPLSAQAVDAETLVQHGENKRAQLESSRAETQPVKPPKKKKQK